MSDRTPGTVPIARPADTPTVCPMCDGTGSTDDVPGADALVAACDVLVLRALERAGNRLLTRALRGTMRDVPSHLLHTRVPARPEQLDRLLDGAWDAVEYVVGEHGCCGTTPGPVVRILDRYVRDLLLTGYPHEVRSLRFTLGRVVG